MGITSRKSFSLIEIVIVVGIIGMVLPILFAIVFLIMQQQIRIYALQEVKKQGDQAMNSIRSTVRQYGTIVSNPTLIPTPTITDICPIYPTTITPMPFIYVYNRDMIGFSYSLTNDAVPKIASNSAHAANPVTDLPLTNDKVTVSDLKFSCYKTNQFSPPIVYVYFKVTKSGGGANPPSMEYSTRFKLKNY